MAVGGPNARRDYHLQTGEEFFVEGGRVGCEGGEGQEREQSIHFFRGVNRGSSEKKAAGIS